MVFVFVDRREIRKYLYVKIIYESFYIGGKVTEYYCNIRIGNIITDWEKKMFF